MSFDSLNVSWVQKGLIVLKSIYGTPQKIYDKNSSILNHVTQMYNFLFVKPIKTTMYVY